MSDFRRFGRRWARTGAARPTSEDASAEAARQARASKQEIARQRRRVRRLQGALIDLSRSVSGREVSQVPGTTRLTALAERAQLQRERAQFVTALVSGSSWGQALLTTTRGLLAQGRTSEVVALALRLEAAGLPDAEVAVALALAADHQGNSRLVRTELHRAGPAALAADAAVAGVRAGVLTDDDDLINPVLESLPTISTDELVTIACLLRSSRRESQSRRAVAELAERWGQRPPKAKASRLMRWLAPTQVDHERSDEPRVGVLSSIGPIPLTSQQPGSEASCLSTVAGLALVMHAVGRTSAPGADAAAEAPTGSEKPVVHLVPRNHSNWLELPGPVWTVAAGRFPSSPFGIRPEFPFAPSVEPLFLGFSLTGVSELDDASIDYLRSKEPIGCSDVPSVFILLKAGVRAFYSGRIEAALPKTMAALPDLRSVDLVGAGRPERDCLDRTVEEVMGVATESGAVQTSVVGRLVLARALGRPAQFRGGKRGHARLDGPVHHRDGLPPEPELAGRMVQSVEEVLRVLAAGGPAQAVRDAWAHVWAADVQAAEQVWQESGAAPPTSDAPSEAAALIRAGGRHYGPGTDSPDLVHVSLATDDNLLDQLPVTIEAIVCNASRPLHISVLTRRVDADVERRLAAAHPAVDLSFYPCDAVEHGGRLIKHITASTMDRLLLPEILDGVARTVYVDIDALVLDDIGELFDWDLGGAPVAARTSEYSLQSIAVELSKSLTPDLAREMRDTVLRRLGHRAPGFNAGILVLDLERMRMDDFCRTFVPWVSRYHLNDQEVLGFYAGDELVRLPERWNSWPYKEVLDAPAVLHWIGPFKPWRQTITREQHRWTHYARLAEERRRATVSSTLPSASDL